MKLIEAWGARATKAFNWCHIAKVFVDLLINSPTDVKINIICIRKLSTKIGIVWFLGYNAVRKTNLRLGASYIHCVSVITSCTVPQC